ncbi:MAG: hypothetical protein CMP14_01460 [Rickettsiales bacterium]|nr:hypothetical protein [Rickettsiales bacterium]
MTYAWIITKDKISSDDVGTTGPASNNSELEKSLKAGKGQEFKMFDDDQTLYYEGLIVGDYTGFEPLDDFGMPNAGCTAIAYKNKSNVFEII